MSFKESILIPKSVYLQLVSHKNKGSPNHSSSNKKTKQQNERRPVAKKFPEMSYELLKDERRKKRVAERARRRNLNKYYQKKREQSQVEPPGLNSDGAEGSLLDNFPENKRHYVARLLSTLRKYRSVISWNPRNYQVTINGVHYPGSNLVDIIYYLCMDGYNTFIKAEGYGRTALWFRGAAWHSFRG